jgi:hypothetical protein
MSIRPAVACLGLLSVLLTSCGHETPHDVRVSIEQIASISAEGALMADDLSKGRTKTTFVRVHGEDLSSQAEHEAEKLHDAPVDPGEIGGAIDDMRVNPQDRSRARENELKLQRWSDEVSRIAESI